MAKIKLIKNEGAKRTHLGRCKNCGKGWRQTFYLDELEPDVKAYLKEKGYADNADICPDCIAAVKDYLAKGKSEGADDILAKHAGDYWYHRYYNSMRRLNLHYKLNGKEQPVLRVGGIDVIHVAHVLGDALAHVHPELKAGAKKMDNLIDSYYKDHSDENAKKFFLNMVRELVPQAFPGVEVLDVTSAWNKDPDGENEGMKRHPGQPINKISPNQDADKDAVDFQKALDNMLDTYFDGRDRRRTKTRLITTFDSPGLDIPTSSVELLVDREPLIRYTFCGGEFTQWWSDTDEIEDNTMSDYDDAAGIRNEIEADLLEHIRDALHEM